MNEGYCVVFDCESDCGVPRCVSPQERDLHIERYMQFTVICALQIPSQMVLERRSHEEILRASKRFCYWRDGEKESTNPNPVHHLLELFDGADVIVGFNCLGFDFPLLKRFYIMGQARVAPSSQRYMDHRSKCLDIMMRVRDATGMYTKLDNLLKTNSLPTKSGDGAEAITLWSNDERDKLKDYCATDVDVTARLALTETILVEAGARTVTVQHQVHGLRCALAAVRAAGFKREREEDYVLV